MILLLLCLVATAFGCLVIASATNYMGSLRFVVVQLVSLVLGVMCYIFISSIDAEFFSEHRMAMLVFNILLLLMLIPFGIRVGGNKSWLHFPFLPVNIQPAEICKITYILIMASVMNSHQNNISSAKSVVHIVFHLLVLMGLNVALSDDWGVSLIFAFIFIGMAFTGGVSMWWFIAGIAALAAFAPFAWNYVLAQYQRDRILVLFFPEQIDPLGIDERYHTVQSLNSLTGGGWTGQGLFQGNRTQAGALTAQHTDYIFSAIGEELGFVGCIAVLVLLLLIVARIIWVGTRSQDYMRRLICFGVAASMIFQITINVGMCIGVTPVIGLTLPFFSSGGSSLVTMYAMMGLVSGVYARPASSSHQLYVQPY